MHTLMLCALLTASQTNAVCWKVTSRASCDQLITSWLADAALWYARNPDVVPLPQVWCGTGELPPGARWVGSKR